MAGMIEEDGGGTKGQIAEAEPATGEKVEQPVVVAFYIALLTGTTAVLYVYHFSR